MYSCSFMICVPRANSSRVVDMSCLSAAALSIDSATPGWVDVGTTRKDQPGALSDQVDRVGGLVMAAVEADRAYPPEQSSRDAGVPSAWVVWPTRQSQGCRIGLRALPPSPVYVTVASRSGLHPQP